MKRFLTKKWHRLPIGIMMVVMALVLVAGSAFAAFNFLTLTTQIEVDEPLTIEYNLQGQYGGDWNWYPLGDTDSLTLQRSAGDSFAMLLKITNRADNALTVNTVMSCVPAGGLQWFNLSGWPNGTANNCPHGPTTFNVTVDVAGEAPPGFYDVTFDFTRE